MPKINLNGKEYEASELKLKGFIRELNYYAQMLDVTKNSTLGLSQNAKKDLVLKIKEYTSIINAIVDSY